MSSIDAKKQLEKDEAEYRDKTRKRCWIISVRSGRFFGKGNDDGTEEPGDEGANYLLWWQVFVMILAIYNSFITPF